MSAANTGEQELIGHFTRAEDYGDFRLALNGQPLSRVVSGYSDKVTPSGAISFGRVPLKVGANQLTLEITGKDARSRGYFVGIDGFLLKP